MYFLTPKIFHYVKAQTSYFNFTISYVTSINIYVILKIFKTVDLSMFVVPKPLVYHFGSFISIFSREPSVLIYNTDLPTLVFRFSL